MNPGTVTGFPHSFRALTVGGIYGRLIMAVSIPVGFGMLHGGATVVVLVAATVIAAVLTDLLVTSLLPETPASPADGRAVYLGLVVAALLPASASVPLAALAGALAILGGVWLVGGPGRYWVHPALVGLALSGIVLSGPATVGEAGASFTFPISLESLPMMEQSLFEPLGVRIPADAWRLLVGTIGPEGGAVTMALLGPVLVAALIVFGEDLLPGALPIGFLLSYVIGVWLFGGLPEEWGRGEPFYALMLTNAPFVIICVLADPGIRPKTQTGMLLFGLLAGGVAALLWITDLVTVPAVAAVLVTGMFVPVIDRVTTRRR
jgi:Na+-translocating ferredoxin:NAD+ oxidoreductase RnfD subunit